ncbi:MAG: T9SS type A sorting domain-containing protein, partial [Chloroflexota bacterium]
NKLMYTSMSFETGYDSISYIVAEKNNPLSYSEPVKVKIKLQPNPAYPWGVNDSVTMIAGSTIVIHPLENDIHNGFDSLVIKAVTILNNDYSGLVENTDHTITYTAPYQANGVQRIQYIMAPVDSGYSYMGRGEILLNIIGVPYYDSLTINNINAGVGADGTLFSMVYRFEDGHYWGAYHQHFKVPANQPASTIFSNTFIVGGYNQNNNLHIARKWEDWKTGPVSAVYDDEYDSRYLRLWKLTREEIEYHKQNYQAPNYQSSEAITNWPGNGRWNSGEALHLAPFYDVNGDDNYIPADGDYPLIRGDECIFFMCNDNTLRTDTLGQPLNAELHGMVYAFNNPDDTALNNTIFVHYDIFNRSQNNYTNCYASVFNDFDIGGGTNDYYRTDVGRSSIIGYNGEDYDWANEQYAYTGNPPAQSITVLAGPFMDPDNNDNPSGECDESVNGINFNNGIPDDERVGLSSALSYQTMEHSIFGQDYVDATEWYNFMKAIWDDETHVLYGGNGHISNGGNGTNARYMFPGDSDPLNYGTNCQLPGNGFNQGTKFWTEEQARNNYSDRRGLASMGPFTLAPGQAQEIDLAYCAGLGNNGAMSSVNQLLRNIDSLRNAVAQGRIVIPNNSLGIAPKNLQTTLSLYPNPATDVIVVANHFSDTKAEYSIFNILGVKVSVGYLIGEKPTINISNLNHGIFVIKVTDGITVSNGKFIKQ